MTDTDALDEISDMTAPPPSAAKSTKQRVAGQRFGKASARRSRAAEHAHQARHAWFCETKRPPPTLPRVKWLERPDPFES